jgi:tetratricopeptide (TPR) repeat protein
MVRGGNDTGEGQSKTYLRGTLLLHRGDHEGARRCFEEALSEERRRKDPSRLIEILVNLGNVCAVMGDREEARSLYQEVLELQRQLPDSRTAGLTLVNLGNLSREMGEFDRARAYYLEGADFLDKAADERSLAILYGNFGLLEQDLGRMQEAAGFFKKAIDLHKKTGYEEGLAVTWGQLGRNFLIQGNDKEAETCFNYASTHFARLSDPTGEAEALRCLADVYEKRSDPELALRCLVRVVEIHRQFGLPVLRADQAWLARLKKRPPTPPEES